MTSQQKIAGYALGICLAVGMSVIAAAPAEATDGDYIYDLNNAGIGGPTDQLISVGRSVCGQPRDASIQNITASTALAEADAAFLYDSAVRFLCT